MSECDEVAASMALAYGVWLAAHHEACTMDTARRYVRMQLVDESMTLIDNVAESLYRHSPKE